MAPLLALIPPVTASMAVALPLPDRQIDAVVRYLDAPPQGWTRRDIADLTQGRGFSVTKGDGHVVISLRLPLSEAGAGAGLLARWLEPRELRPEDWTRVFPEGDGPYPRREFGLALASVMKRVTVGATPPGAEAVLEERVPTLDGDDATAGFAETTLAATIIGAGKGSLLFRSVRQETGYAYSPYALVRREGPGWGAEIVVPHAGEELGAEARNAFLAAARDVRPGDVERARAILRGSVLGVGPFHPFPYRPDGGAFRAWYRLLAGRRFEPGRFLSQVEAIAAEAASARVRSISESSSWNPG